VPYPIIIDDYEFSCREDALFSPMIPPEVLIH